MKKNLCLITLICACICVSCNDFFELKRPQETQWTTTSTFEQGLSSAYWNMQWGEDGRGFPHYLDFLTSGTASLMQGNTPGLDGERYFYRSFEEKLGRMSNIWKWNYNVITKCNLALDVDRDGEGNPFNLDIAGDDYQHNYLRQVAEYHFCRAYAYWRLIKVFAPPYNHGGGNDQPIIPLKETASYSKEEVENEELGSVEQVYDLIIRDLIFAKENLPDQFTKNSWNDVSGYECGRANKWVATALLGKVYFLMGWYKEAKAEFDALIEYAESTGTYQLEEPKAPFNKEKAGDIPKESIWEFNSGFLDGQFERHNNYMYCGMVMGLRFRDSNGDELVSLPGNNEGTVLSSWNAFGIAYTALKEMGWMVDPMNGDYTITPEAEADLRYQQVYHLMLPYKEGIVKGDPEYLTTESLSGHAMVNTPHVYIDKFFRGATPYGKFSKFPFIRLADIYLLRAWLRWNDGDLQGAANDMNIVWNRANPQNPDIYTSANVNHDAIYREYLREMTGEGWTVDFMMGTQMVIPAGDSELNTEVAPPYSNWYWPIPDSETTLNHKYD